MKQRDAKWNPKTQSGTYPDKIHWGELKINNPFTGTNMKQTTLNGETTPTRLTPLQEAIHWFQTEPEAIGRWNTDDIVKMLTPFLPAEKKLLEEVWEAGEKSVKVNCKESQYPNNYSGVHFSHQDINKDKQQFLSQFKSEQ